MISINREHSLKTRLFLTTMLLIFGSVALISTVGALWYRQYSVSRTAKQNQALVEQLSINTASYIDELSRLSLAPYYNQTIMQLLDSNPSDLPSKLNKRREIEGFLREVMTIPRKEILRVYIMSDDVYASTRTSHGLPDDTDYINESWYQSALSQNNIIFLPVQKETVGGYTLSVFSLVRRLNSLNGDNLPIGVIRVDANYSGISQVLDSVEISPGCALFIFDDSANIIYSHNLLSDVQTAGEILSYAQNGITYYRCGSTDYLLNTVPISGTDWHICNITSKTVILKETSPILTFSLVLAGICSLLGMIVTALSVGAMTKPINDTISVMTKAQEGDLDVQAPESKLSEINYLNSTFNTMLTRIKETIEHNTRLIQEMYEARYLQKKAQYDSLYQQIQPHFLFNTLSTVSLLVKSGKDTDAIAAIDDLSLLLRGMVNTDREIPMQNEIKITTSYLRLQARRHDNLTYTIAEDPVLNNIHVPAMTVQPLVENAIIHGCEPKCAPAHIDISTFFDGKYAVITVSDNGVGMNPEQCNTVADLLTHPDMLGETIDSRSVGLANIAQRLKLMYGDKCSFKLTSEINKGTIVKICIDVSDTLKPDK